MGNLPKNYIRGAGCPGGVRGEGMKKYYVYANGKGYKVSRHEFKSDKAAIAWFTQGYHGDPDVALYREVSPVLDIFTDRRIA